MRVIIIMAITGIRVIMVIMGFVTVKGIMVIIRVLTIREIMVIRKIALILAIVGRRGTFIAHVLCADLLQALNTFSPCLKNRKPRFLHEYSTYIVIETFSVRIILIE